MPTLTETARATAISKDAFERDYRIPGKPVVLESLTHGWRARDEWSADYLKRVVGHARVPLYESRASTEHRHQHAAAAEMPLGEYLDLLARGENDLRVFFLDVRKYLPELVPDFHFPNLGLELMTRLPVLFVGGRGSRVQMHFDVDLAHVLLCHFGGKKRVMLFAPDQTPYLYRVPFSFSTLFNVRPDAPDYERYPALRHARGEIAELAHGDALYIPPGYWHYVLYDDIGFSLSMRAPPRTPRRLAAVVYNIAVVRNAEALMRKVLGRRWLDRNERLAVERTHRRLGLL